MRISFFFLFLFSSNFVCIKLCVCVCFVLKQVRSFINPRLLCMNIQYYKKIPSFSHFSSKNKIHKFLINSQYWERKIKITQKVILTSMFIWLIPFILKPYIHDNNKAYIEKEKEKSHVNPKEICPIELRG